MKRFWDRAWAAESDNTWSILLDGKPMRIPGGAPLRLVHRPLAEAIAAEWQEAGGSKGGTLSLDAVPLTRLAGTAQDRVAPQHAAIAAELARFAESDLLCYRAAHPEPLVIRQARAWQPWLDWAARTYGAHLEPREGIVFRPQDPASLTRIHDALAARTDFELAALGIAIPILGSAVLGLALADAALTGPEAHDLSCLDELYEIGEWGEDPEAAKRRQSAAADIVLAERFLRLSTAS